MSDPERPNDENDQALPCASDTTGRSRAPPGEAGRVQGEPVRAPECGQTWGKYLIEKHLGRGGQAVVLQAFDRLGPAVGRRRACYCFLLLQMGNPQSSESSTMVGAQGLSERFGVDGTVGRVGPDKSLGGESVKPTSNAVGRQARAALRTCWKHVTRLPCHTDHHYRSGAAGARHRGMA